MKESLVLRRPLTLTITLALHTPVQIVAPGLGFFRKLQTTCHLLRARGGATNACACMLCELVSEGVGLHTCRGQAVMCAGAHSARRVRARGAGTSDSRHLFQVLVRPRDAQQAHGHDDLLVQRNAVCGAPVGPKGVSGRCCHRCRVSCRAGARQKGRSAVRPRARTVTCCPGVHLQTCAMRRSRERMCTAHQSRRRGRGGEQRDRALAAPSCSPPQTSAAAAAPQNSRSPHPRATHRSRPTHRDRPARSCTPPSPYRRRLRPRRPSNSLDFALTVHALMRSSRARTPESAWRRGGRSGAEQRWQWLRSLSC